MLNEKQMLKFVNSALNNIINLKYKRNKKIKINIIHLYDIYFISEFQTQSCFSNFFEAIILCILHIFYEIFY